MVAFSEKSAAAGLTTAAAQLAESALGGYYAAIVDSHIIRKKEAGEAFDPTGLQTFINANLDWCTNNPAFYPFMWASIPRKALMDSSFGDTVLYTNEKCIGSPLDLKYVHKKGDPIKLKHVKQELLVQSGNRYNRALNILKSIQHLPKKGGSTTTILKDGSILRVHDMSDAKGRRQLSVLNFGYGPYRPIGLQ
jgi:hypothetical protein